MRSKLLIILTAALTTVSIFASSPDANRSSDQLINFAGKNLPPRDALLSLGLQTGLPVGIELGDDIDGLCTQPTSISVRAMTPVEVVNAIVKGTGYAVRREDGVILVVTPNLTARQQSLLDYRYELFPAGTDQTMAGLGAKLTGWMQMEAEHVPTFAGVTSHALDSDRVRLGDIFGADTEQIANRIVVQGKGGLWIFKSSSVETNNTKDEVAIYSYADDAAAIRGLGCKP
jgi:hypothetical protein